MMDDIDEDERYGTQAEAILRAMMVVADEGGGTLALHLADCDFTKSKCTCEPVYLSVPQEMPESL